MNVFVIKNGANLNSAVSQAIMLFNTLSTSLPLREMVLIKNKIAPSKTNS